MKKGKDMTEKKTSSAVWAAYHEAKKDAEAAHDFYAHTGFGWSEASKAAKAAAELKEAAEVFESKVVYGSGSPPY